MPSSRSRSRTPYAMDDMAVQIHHSAAGILWRWRTEILILLALATGLNYLTRYMHLWQAAALAGVLLAVIVAVPYSRRFAAGRVWCIITRHRLHRLFWNEPRLHTRTGRIPMVVWIRPTQVGVRAHIVCRAGICHQDFADSAAQIAAACFAREARITRSPRYSHLVTADIIRRDTLAAKKIITSPLPALPARHQAAAPALRADVPAPRQETTLPAAWPRVIPFPARRSPRPQDGRHE